MINGSVVWFSDVKGYGFCAREDGAPDCFIHQKSLARSGLNTLTAGQRVKFLLVEDRKSKRLCIEHIELLI